MKGFGSGIFEIALAWRGDAYRAVYAVLIDEAVCVVHAFQKKSKTGIKTPKAEIDLISCSHFIAPYRLCNVDTENGF